MSSALGDVGTASLARRARRRRQVGPLRLPCIMSERPLVRAVLGAAIDVENSLVKDDDEDTGKIVHLRTGPPRAAEEFDASDGPTRVGPGAYQQLARNMDFESPRTVPQGF